MKKLFVCHFTGDDAEVSGSIVSRDDALMAAAYGLEPPPRPTGKGEEGNFRVWLEKAQAQGATGAGSAKDAGRDTLLLPPGDEDT